MKPSTHGIELTNVTLTYELYHERVHSLKESVVNFFHKRQYVKEKVSYFNALDKIDLIISEGERVGIIGRNGAGKSTLLKVISGILKPTIGSLSVSGSIQPLIEIAAGFNPEFSGRENIYLNGYMLGFSRESIKTKEQEIIAFADLTEFIDVPVKYYSSGMSVRLAFAIATSIEPEYLIFDEMLSAGDAVFQVKAEERIKSLLNKAKILIVVSHSMETIRKLTNRVLVLHHGKIIFDGKPEDGIKKYLALDSN
jgi:ABC-type polysaccharide/polyol phosphate transport system ATPase subunit